MMRALANTFSRRDDSQVLRFPSAFCRSTPWLPSQSWFPQGLAAVRFCCSLVLISPPPRAHVPNQFTGRSHRGAAAEILSANLGARSPKEEREVFSEHHSQPGSRFPQLIQGWLGKFGRPAGPPPFPLPEPDLAEYERLWQLLLPKHPAHDPK